MMTHRFLHAALILMLSISVSVNAKAGPAPEPVEPDTTSRPMLRGTIQVPGPNDSAQVFNEKLEAARRLIAEGQYLSASALLEIMHDDDPENMVVLNLLRNCYDQLDYPSKTEAMMRKMLERHPNQFEYIVYLGQALAKQGKTKEADSLYQYARSLIPPQDVQRMGSLIKNMVEGNASASALKLIDSLRVKSGDSLLYALERGKIFEQMHQYDKAALEYLAVIADPEVRGMTARMNLLALLDYPESSAPAEQALRTIKTKPRQTEALKILSQYYLKADRFTDAFNTALQLDSVGEQKGQNLLFYMRACQDRKLYREGVRMGNYYLKQYAASPMAGEMFFHLGDAYVGLGIADSAITCYRTAADRSPIVSDKADAMYRVGMAYLDVAHDYARARAVFDTVIANYREGLGWFQSQAKRPMTFLKEGNLADAEQAYTKAAAMNLDGDDAEEVNYYLAYTLFLEKQIDSCSAKLHRLQVDYPRGVYFNDAMSLILVMTTVTDNQALLDQYAQAEYYRITDKPVQTDSVFEMVLTAEDKRLSDLACYRLAESTLKQNDTTKAVAYLDRGVHEFGESFYHPYMLKLLADIRSVQRGQAETARQLYRELLEKYPNHPYSKDARKRMKALENTV